MRFKLSIKLGTFLVATLVAASHSFGATGLTYHGRIVKPNGAPLEAATVFFNLQIRSPNAENCLLFEEQQTLPMAASNGVFVLTIGDGTRSAAAIDGGNSLDRIFANKGVISGAPNLSCNIGTTYTPGVADGRKLLVQFNDGTGWQTLPVQNINYTPLAIEAIQISGYKKDQLLRVADGVTATEFTAGNWTALWDLITGNSNLYLKNDGSNFAPTGSIDYNGQKIVDLADPTAAQDGATKNYVDTRLGGRTVDMTGVSNVAGDGKVLSWNMTLQKWEGVLPVDSTKLPLAGGIMSGAIQMNTFKITGMGDPVAAQDASTKAYSDANLRGSALATPLGQAGKSIRWNAADTAWEYFTPFTAADLTNANVVSALGYTPVSRAGDTMTGLLILSGDPSNAVGAATKQYVDAVSTASSAAYVRVDGTTSLTADWDLNGLTVGGTRKVVGLDAPTVADGAATKGYVDASATAVGTAANAYADGVAATAESDANTYTDGEITALDASLQTYADGVAATAESNAKTYADGKLVTKNLAVPVLAQDGQSIRWNNTAGAWEYFTASVSSGTVSNVSSANTDIGVATGSTTPVLTLNVGTGNNQIVKLNGSAELPAVSGVNLTALNASNVASGTLADARLSANVALKSYVDAADLQLITKNLAQPVAGDDLKVIRWNQTAGNFEYASDSSTDSTKLPLGGGTMSGNIIMGSNSITGLAAPSAGGDAANKTYVDANLRGQALATPVGQAGKSIRWNAGDTAWEYYTPTDGTVTGVTSANTDIGVGGTAAAPILTLNSGTGASQIVKLNASSELPAVSGVNLTSLNATNLASGTVADARLSANVALKSYVDAADLKLITKNLAQPVAGDDLKVIRWNQTAGNFEYASDSSTDSTKLPLGGGTMSGAIAMGNNAITGLPAPSAAGDAVDKTYADAREAAAKTYADGKLVTKNLAVPVLAQDGQSIRWNNTAGAWEYFTAGSGSGTVSSVTTANTDLSISNTTTTPQITVNTGTGNNQLVKLNGSAELPAVSGVNLTALNASNIASGTLADARLSSNVALKSYADANLRGQALATPVGQAGKSIRWNAGDTAWEYYTPAAGSVTSVATGTGLTGGPITGTGTISIAAGGVSATELASDAVVTAKILDKNVTYAKIQDVSATNRLLGRATAGSGVMEEITLGTGLSFTGTTLNATGSGGTVTAVSSANTDASVATGSTTPVITINTGTGNNQLVKLNGSAELPAVSGVNLTALNATNIASGTLADARLSANVALKSYVDAADLKLITKNLAQPVAGDDLKVIRWNQTAGNFEYAVDSSTDSTKLPLGGGTMSGNIIMGSNSITGLAAPSAGGDAVNKTYADGKWLGLTLAAPGAGEVGKSVRWNAAGNAWEYYTAGSGSGTVTQVTSANTDIGITNTGTTPELTLNVGTGASQIVKLNASSELPAVSGVNLTNLDASDLATGTLADARLSANVALKSYADANLRGQALATPVGQAGKSIRWNAGDTAWEYYTPAAGSVTSVATGTGLTGGTITGTGTISIAAAGVSATELASDAVTTAKILAKNVTYAKIQDVTTNNRILGRATAGAGVMEEITLGTGLSFTGTTLNATGTGGTVTQVTSATTDIGITNTTSIPELTLNVGTGNNQIVKLNGSAQLPAVSGINLTALNATNIASGTLDDSRLSSNVALKSYADANLRGNALATPVGQAGKSIRWNAGNTAWEYYTPTDGTVTGVTSANTDIGVGGTAAAPILTLNAGTGASQIVKLNASSELPAVSGVNLTNLDASDLATGTVADARLSSNVALKSYADANLRGQALATPVGQAGKSIRWNAGDTAWEYYTPVAGATNIDGLSDAISAATGSYTLALGAGALDSQTTGSENLAVGLDVLTSLLDGTENTGVGQWSLYSTTSGSQNTAVGLSSLESNTTGSDNTAVGVQALQSNLVGISNAALGISALHYNRGSGNTAVGAFAQNYKTTGDNNTAIGHLAGYGTPATASADNVFLGYRAGYAVSTGGTNVFLGSQAGESVTTGANNILIGYDVDAPTATTANHLNIGNTIYADLSTDKVGVGTTSPTKTLDVAGIIGATSATTASAIQPLNNASTNSLRNVASFTRVRGDATAPNAMSGGLQFELEGFTNNSNVNSNAMIWGWEGNQTDDTTSRDSYFSFSTTQDNVLGERVRISSAGNVGIGNNNPSTALDVTGVTAVEASVESASSYVASGAAYTIPNATSNIRRITLDNNTTITLPAFSSLTGKAWSLTVMVKQDGTGSRTLAWGVPGGDSILWDSSASAPTPATGANKITIYQFLKPADETTWYGSMVWKQN